MKKLPLFFALLALAGTAHSQAAIAVSSCRVTGLEPAAAWESFVMDAFTAELSRFPAVKALDRRALDAQLAEIELSLSGLVDSNGAVEAGALIGAGWILTGSLSSFGPSSTVLSVQLISTSTGEVGFAASEIIAGSGLPAVQERIASVASALVRRLEPGAAAVAESLWVTRAGDGSSPGEPILLWVMSNVDDAADANGAWYLGPAQLKPLTDRLKEEGHAVVVHDRRTLARLTDLDLSAYSQLWIVEGDGDARVDPGPAEAAALKAFYDAGGAIWLSAENVLEPEASWTEDVNALARPFGASVGGIAICAEPGLPVTGTAGPLFDGVGTLVYDDEIGIVSLAGRGFTVLLEAPADARMVAGRWTPETMMKYIPPERLRELASNPYYDYRWLFAGNFTAMGKPAGTGKAVLAIMDGRAGGKGMVLIDSGWLIGWTFNGPQGRLRDTGQNMEFLLNVAAYFAAGK